MAALAKGQELDPTNAQIKNTMDYLKKIFRLLKVEVGD